MIRHPAKLAVAALGAGTALTAPTLAQEAASVRDDAKIVKLSDFDASQYQDGWLADEMLDSTVYGRNADEVGTVQSIIINKEGQVERLIVEVGGFLEIGDKVIAVPWSEVDVTPGEAGVMADINAENIESFSLFNDRESVETGPRSFRASGLIGDYARLKNGDDYGYVRDLLFDRQGKLQSIITEPDIGYAEAGYYAYPYYGYGYDYGYDFDPGLDYYGLPYGADEAGEYEPFDYEAFDDDIA
jgi:PRC-barrel domain